MIAPFIFLGFINFVSCVNENERKPHKPSEPNACNVFINHSNLDYENSQVSHLHSDGPCLFGSELDRSNKFIELDRFIFHDQDTKLDQFINQFDYTIPDLTTFGKDQGIQSQTPINNLYLTPTSGNQQSSVNRASFRSTILSQNLLNSDQNALTSNLQLYPIGSSQIQEFQNTLIGPNLQLDHTEGALTRLVKSNHRVDMDLGDREISNKKLKQPLIRRKCQRMPWKIYEFNNLLKGLNECGKHWKKILDSYKFGEGRTGVHLYSKFNNLRRKGRIVHTKDSGWKFVNQRELTDLVRGEGENEQIQSEKESQRDAKLVNNKSEHELGNLDQNNAGEVIENSDQDHEGLSFVGANKKRRQISWKSYEFINLIKGVNLYGTSWKKIRESLEFEQGRTPVQLSLRFHVLKKHGQVIFIKDFGWNFVNEGYLTHLDENNPSKATENQRQGKEQKQSRPFFVKKTRSRKRHNLSWKKRELDNLLEGVNKYGRNWKKILDSHKFEKGRTRGHLHSKFCDLEKRGQITYGENSGWKLTDLCRERICDKVVFDGEQMRKSFSVEKVFK